MLPSPGRCGPFRLLLPVPRSDLVPVDPFGDCGAAVADQAGDDLDGALWRLRGATRSCAAAHGVSSLAG
jgi:hypothetical protein